jgi:hypothetical protein
LIVDVSAGRFRGCILFLAARILWRELVACQQSQFMTRVLQEWHEHCPDKSRGAGDSYFHLPVVWGVGNGGLVTRGLGCML